MNRKRLEDDNGVDDDDLYDDADLDDDEEFDFRVSKHSGKSRPRRHHRDEDNDSNDRERSSPHRGRRQRYETSRTWSMLY